MRQSRACRAGEQRSMAGQAAGSRPALQPPPPPHTHTHTHPHPHHRPTHPPPPLTPVRPGGACTYTLNRCCCAMTPPAPLPLPMGMASPLVAFQPQAAATFAGPGGARRAPGRPAAAAT